MALIVGGLFFLGFIPSDDNSSSMEIIFYDADGNELGRSGTILGIQSPPDFEGNIDHLDVVVYFQVTTDIDYNLMTTKCMITIETRLNTITGSVVHSIAEHQLGATNSDESGTFYATYLMSTLLPDNKIESLGKANGWQMYFDAKVTTAVSMDRVDSKVVEDTCGTQLTLAWVEDGLTLESWFGNW